MTDPTALLSSSLHAGLPRPARRRVLAGLGAGMALAAVPGARVLAQQQREGVPVGPPSHMSSLAPPSDAVEQQAAQEYNQLLQQARAKNLLANQDHPQVVRLRYIEERLRPFTYMWNERARNWQWEVNLIGSKSVNAFCMPGGKIAFFWGILTELKLEDDEVAMIMGHEMTHALREHAREQMGKQTMTQGLIGIGAAVLGLGSSGRYLAGMGGQLLSLKYSRDDESEADLVGLELAARAGYDPKSALTLWRKMEALGGSQPTAFLSDHPSNPDRMSQIERNIPNVMGLYERAPKPDRHFGPPGSATKSNASSSPAAER
jgi:Zn-dependent protease with chaperone function